MMRSLKCSSFHPRHRASRGKGHDRSGSYLNRRIGRKTRGEIKQAEARRDDDDLEGEREKKPRSLATRSRPRAGWLNPFDVIPSTPSRGPTTGERSIKKGRERDLWFASFIAKSRTGNRTLSPALSLSSPKRGKPGKPPQPNSVPFALTTSSPSAPLLVVCCYKSHPIVLEQPNI